MKTCRIDVISDTVCPWCYVGKRQLDHALARRDDVDAAIHWQPFQLAPDVPVEGVDRKTYWREKFGDNDRIGDMVERLKTVGATLNIPFDFDAIQTQPNTLASHKLLHWQSGSAHQHALKEAILDAFFVKGMDIGNHDTLVQLAAGIGLDPAEARTALESDASDGPLKGLIDQARKLGVTGVPTFIFNERVAISGAQPAESLLQALDQSLADA